MQIVMFSTRAVGAVQLPQPQEVHIWTVLLNEREPLAALGNELTDEETARALRFRFVAVREQFILARGWLRTILGQYLGIRGRDVAIAYEPGGKPYLSQKNFHFNLSHSGEGALVGVSRSRVGIDIEQRKPMPNAEGLVERYFSPREQSDFLSIAPEQRIDAFYRAWTRKEAILKAIGSGVQALEDCEVTFQATDAASLLRLGDDRQANEKWFLHGWDVGDGYEAAVAVER